MFYSGKRHGSGLWRFNYKQEGAPKDGQSPSIDYSWLPNEELAGAWRLLNNARPEIPAAKIDKVSFETAAGKQDFYVRMPSEFVGNDAALPKNVIVWLTRENDEKSINQRILGQGDPVIRFAELNNIPIIIWNANSIWPAEHLQNAKLAEEKLVLESDQNFIRVGDAMIGRIKEYCRQKGWPVRDWMLSADTAASRYGLMMAQAYPFLAVHLHSASGYERIKNAPSVPWLVTSGWLEGGNKESIDFYRKAGKELWPVVFKIYPGVGHRTSWIGARR